MEPMALERLVARRWELDDFFTRLRTPVMLPSGQTSDIDVIGVDADGYVRIAECKVRGPSRWVGVPSGDFTEWLDDRGWLNSIENLSRLWTTGTPPAWLPFRRQTTRVEFWLVANVWFPSDDARRQAERSLTRTIRGIAPHGLKARTEARVVSTLDVVLETLEVIVQRSGEDWGRRYGDPALDVLRELARYSNPRPGGGGRIGSAIANSTRLRLLSALRFDA